MKNLVFQGAWLAVVLCLFWTCAQQERPKTPEENGRSGGGVESDSGQYIEKPLRVTRIEAVEVGDRQALFKVKVQTPDLCWKFSRYEVDWQNGEVLITVYGKRDRHEICAQMIGSFETEIPVKARQSGEMGCRFWSGENEAPLDTAIIIR